MSVKIDTDTSMKLRWLLSRDWARRKRSLKLGIRCSVRHTTRGWWRGNGKGQRERWRSHIVNHLWPSQSHAVTPTLHRCATHLTHPSDHGFSPFPHYCRHQRPRHNHSGIRDILSRPNRFLSPLPNTRLLWSRPPPQQPPEQHTPGWGLSPSEDPRPTMVQRRVTRCMDVNLTITIPLYFWLNFRPPVLNCQTHHCNWNTNT